MCLGILTGRNPGQSACRSSQPLSTHQIPRSVLSARVRACKVSEGLLDEDPGMWREQSLYYERSSGCLDKANPEVQESLFLQQLLVTSKLFPMHDCSLQVEPQGELFPMELQKHYFQAANWKPAGGDTIFTRND